METIVVIVVISVALLTIFSSYNKILSKVKTENKYDTSEYIYMTNHIKKSLNSSLSADNIFDCSYDGSGNITCCEELDLNDYHNNSMNVFGAKKVYILTNINKFDTKFKNSTESSQDNTKPSQYFDAYMIDYIRKLDVSDTDELLIVEYEREAINIDGTPKMDANDKPLYETYIASLEWK